MINIGELVKQLQPDFAGLTVSKVRYLEDRGLLTPTRTASGYRKYSREDVRTLRAVLSMQRDQYLPLEVIRQRVADTSVTGGLQERGGDASSASYAALELHPEEPQYTFEGLCAEIGAEVQFVEELIEFRLIEPAADDGAAFTKSDAEIARVCQRLSRHRLEPRNLRILSSAAEREGALIEQVATPGLRSGHGDRREYGLETVRELGSLFSQLTQLLLTRELRRIH